MRALVIDEFGAPGEVREVPEPRAAPDGAVIRVESTGLCRSDWHAWMGHDAGVRLPFVPGHELAGVVTAVGSEVSADWLGARVTTPFVCACGSCEECRRGEQQVCSRQEQPGFTHDGSYAEQVAVRHAEVNLVRLPAAASFDVAAALGCRYGTAWRAVHRRARVTPGERVAVFGCGGLGLSAVILAAQAGAEVIAVDTSAAALRLAAELGAVRTTTDAASLTGLDVALECSGAPALVGPALRSLRPRGRFVQIGLLPTGAEVPMDVVIARELDLLGSHGLAAHDYPALLGDLSPLVTSLIGRTVGLAEGGRLLARPDGAPGITIVRPGLD